MSLLFVCGSLHDDVEGHRGPDVDVESSRRAVRPAGDRNHVQHAVHHQRSVSQQLGADWLGAGSRDGGTCPAVAARAPAARRRHARRHPTTPLDHRLLPVRLRPRSVARRATTNRLSLVLGVSPPVFTIFFPGRPVTCTLDNVGTILSYQISNMILINATLSLVHFFIMSKFYVFVLCLRVCIV